MQMLIDRCYYYALFGDGFQLTFEWTWLQIKGVPEIPTRLGCLVNHYKNDLVSCGIVLDVTELGEVAFKHIEVFARINRHLFVWCVKEVEVNDAFIGVGRIGVDAVVTLFCIL
jgi:hypothetical protein